MKINAAIYCFLAGAALLCTTLALPAAAQSRGGEGHGSGSSGHAISARVDRGRRYDGGWQRGGPRWWDVGFGLGLGWGGAYYLGDPYVWSPGYYTQYDFAPPINMPPGQALNPTGFAVQSIPSVRPDWYYCVSASKYYPYINQCPEAWQKVPATPTGATN